MKSGQCARYPHYRRTLPSNRATQQGAVLMVAMVMIFMMSILGISAMRGASLEGQLANNALQKEITFQAAESATDEKLSQNGALESQICSPDEVTEDLSSQLSDGTTGVNHTTEAKTLYGGRTHPVDWSMGGPVTARRFVVTGVSSLPDVNTSTTISQGVVIIGAADATGDC